MTYVFQPGLIARQHIQRGRVLQGVQNHQIDTTELASLKELRNNYVQTKATYLEDGQLTKDERLDLHGLLNASSQAIFESRWLM